MIPFRDNIPSRRAPVVTVTLIAINALVFLFQAGLGGIARERLIFRLGVIPHEFEIIGRGPEVVEVRHERLVHWGIWQFCAPIVESYELEGTWAGAVVPLLTSMFLHGSWLHLIGNMWFLWLFGDNVEDRLGRPRFLLLVVLCGLIASAAQVAVNWGDNTPMIGASGAVAGVLGGYLVTYPYARVLCFVPFFHYFWPVVELPAFVFLLLWLAMQFVQGTAALATPGSGGVAWWAHVGGFIAGLVLMRMIAPSSRDSADPHGSIR